MSIIKKGNGEAISETNPLDVKMTGSFIRLAAEAKPTVAQDGDDLLLVDTGVVFIFYKGTWYPQ